MRLINEIIVHCTATQHNFMPGATTAARVAEVRRWHLANGWSDIGYHYLIDRDGTVAKGRPLEKVGAHVKNRNTGTIGISLFGGHGSAATDQFSDHFTQAQDASLRALIDELRGRFGNLAVTGHNQFAAKACPGFNAPAWWSRKPAGKPAPLPPAPVVVSPAPDTAVKPESPWAALWRALASIFNRKGA